MSIPVTVKNCGAANRLRVSRHNKLTPLARRLTPMEIAQHWFRRGRDFASQIHDTFADFPKPAPDGLYLLSQVEDFFNRFHSANETRIETAADEQAQAMRAALGNGSH